MPAAAVIPAPIAYIKVVAVKKLVVELLAGRRCGFGRAPRRHPPIEPHSAFAGRRGETAIYFEKTRVFQAG